MRFKQSKYNKKSKAIISTYFDWRKCVFFLNPRMHSEDIKKLGKIWKIIYSLISVNVCLLLSYPEPDLLCCYLHDDYNYSAHRFPVTTTGTCNKIWLDDLNFWDDFLWTPVHTGIQVPFHRSIYKLLVMDTLSSR